MDVVASIPEPGAVPWAFIRATDGGFISTHSTSFTKRTFTAPKPTDAVARNFFPGSTISSFSRPGAARETFSGSVRNSQTFWRGALMETVPSKCTSVAGEGPGGLAELLGVRQKGLLERRGVGDRRVRRRDAHERPVQ